MLDCSYQTKLDAHFVSRQANQESTFPVIIPATAQSVAHFVREGGNAWHLVYIGFHGKFFLIKLGSTGRPSFTINKDGWIYLVYGSTDFVHRLDVVDAHQVKAEAINVIFVYPVEYGLHHVFTHHGTVAGCLVSATGPVCQFAVLCLAVEVAGHRTLKVAFFGVESMIINHIEYHADTCFVESLYHLLEFLDSYIGLIRIGGIRAVRHIVVLRIIAPVILCLVEFAFVHRCIIV